MNRVADRHVQLPERLKSPATRHRVFSNDDEDDATELIVRTIFQLPLMIAAVAMTVGTARAQTCDVYSSHVYRSGTVSTGVFYTRNYNTNAYEERRVYEAPRRSSTRVYRIQIPVERPKQSPYRSSPPLQRADSKHESPGFDDSDYKYATIPREIERQAVERPEKATAPDLRAESRDAWQALIDGYTKRAFSMFGELCSEQPQDVQYKIGYGLAAAAAGSHKTAIWSMRRAFSQSKTNIAPIPVGHSIAGLLDDLIMHYETDALTPLENRDANFMIAALLYLGHDTDGALDSVQTAREHGDLNRSTTNLRHFLLAEVNVQ